MPFSLDISHRNRYPLSNELTPNSILDCGILTIKKLPGRTPPDNATHDRANGFGVGSAILVSVFLSV